MDRELPDETNSPKIAELQDPRQQANELEVQEKVNELPSPIAELDSNTVSKTCRGTEA